MLEDCRSLLIANSAEQGESITSSLTNVGIRFLERGIISFLDQKLSDGGLLVFFTGVEDGSSAAPVTRVGTLESANVFRSRKEVATEDSIVKRTRNRLVRVEISIIMLVFFACEKTSIQIPCEKN